MTELFPTSGSDGKEDRQTAERREQRFKDVVLRHFCCRHTHV